MEVIFTWFYDLLRTRWFFLLCPEGGCTFFFTWQWTTITSNVLTYILCGYILYEPVSKRIIYINEMRVWTRMHFKTIKFRIGLDLFPLQLAAFQICLIELSASINQIICQLIMWTRLSSSVVLINDPNKLKWMLVFIYLQWNQSASLQSCQTAAAQGKEINPQWWHAILVFIHQDISIIVIELAFSVG